jgi:LPS export ABC transporter protein LptC
MDLKRRLLAVLLCGILVGCGTKTTAPKEKPKTGENKFTLDNFSIEQANQQGQLWWKLKAKQATYTIDRKIAKVNDLSGEFYQDGKVVMRLSAKTADIEQDGERVVLRGNVTASETRNQLVVNSQELEWQPQKDLLTISKNVIANHPQAKATADRGQYISRQQRLELFDKIVVVAPAESLRLQTNYLRWEVETKNISSNQPVLVERFREDKLIERVQANEIAYNLDRQVAEISGKIRFNSLEQAMEVTANSGTWSVKKELVSLRDRIQFAGTQPPLKVTANSAQWNIPQQTIAASQSLEIFHQTEQATFTANNGAIDLKQNIAKLTGNARGSSTRNQASLKAENITWAIDTQQITGQGGVRYQQTNPQLVLTGTTGVGKLQDQTVVVTGSDRQLVETEIIPPPASP